MSGSLPIGRVEEWLRRELGSGRQSFAQLASDEAWFRFIRFGSQRFDTTDTPDTDGPLFQYGTHTFERPPAFTLDFVREFEVNDTLDEHDHYIQPHCELLYEPVPRLKALGHVESWFFHDTDDELDRWADDLARQEVWTTVRHLDPAEIRVYQEQV
ncbi:hypothetical protein [Streptomyces pseudovenezuelae]|uniref:DUF4240 domain-containing protein n=1 Tax=Streptomyces pseudovenezuelae TaxID=67350 RepID=A0ABT6LK02_9ACTN|nr:hypothetical protein [Streptomyces pseudovenezuelae]MDH6216623.1 hypothetical protein [Streptomyces pseudovenezuelae]